MMRRNLVAVVMAEPCIYGGLLATRAEVYEDLAELRGPKGEKLDHLAIDRMVWHCAEATPEDVARLTAAGLTLKAFRPT